MDDYTLSTVPGDTTILAIIACFLGWTTLYFSLVIFHPNPHPRSFRGQSCVAEWHCRLVTIVHASTVVSMSAWCGFVQGPWPFTQPGESSYFSVDFCLPCSFLILLSALLPSLLIQKLWGGVIIWNKSKLFSRLHNYYWGIGNIGHWKRVHIKPISKFHHNFDSLTAPVLGHKLETFGSRALRPTTWATDTLLSRLAGKYMRQWGYTTAQTPWTGEGNGKKAAASQARFIRD